MVSPRYEAAQLVDVLSLVLYLFGVFALYAYLAGTRAERWALAGLVLGGVYLVSLVIVAAASAPGLRLSRAGRQRFAVFV